MFMFSISYSGLHNNITFTTIFHVYLMLRSRRDKGYRRSVNTGKLFTLQLMTKLGVQWRRLEKRQKSIVPMICADEETTGILSRTKRHLTLIQLKKHWAESQIDHVGSPIRYSPKLRTPF